MPLYQIRPNELPQVWPIAAPLLQKAIDLEPEALTIEQVEYQVRTGAYSFWYGKSLMLVSQGR